MGKIECNILGIIVHVMFIAPLIVTMDTSSGGWFLNDLKELKTLQCFKQVGGY